MLPDWVLNPGHLTYESGALPIALHGPACKTEQVPKVKCGTINISKYVNTVELQWLEHLWDHSN